MNNTVIIVPAYNPNQTIMTAFIHELKQSFSRILIINDGSDEHYDSYFEALKDESIQLIHHVVNQGKGRAIKTAFNFLLSTAPFDVAVTADCDGQHSVKDIMQCALDALAHPDHLVLGVRNFNDDNVPPRSRFGNRTTVWVFKRFIGLALSDTQTGLRAFSPRTAKQFLSVNGERYDYETNMLIACKNDGIPIHETPISTIYLNNNQTSHFHPIKDSLIIYKRFFKYFLASSASFLLDIGLFKLFLLVTLSQIKLATILARCLSSLFNYKVNGALIFKQSTKQSLFKYYALVVVVMLASGFSVDQLTHALNINPLLVKIPVDGLLFLLCYVVQREWVFKNPMPSSQI